MKRKTPKPKPRIALIHLAFVYSGGGEKLVLKQADLLTKQGYEVDIYAPIVNSDKCFPDIINNYHIKRLFWYPEFIFKHHESLVVVMACLFAPLSAIKLRRYNLIIAANQPSIYIAYITKAIFRKVFISYLAQPTRFIYPRDVDVDTGLHFVKHETKDLVTYIMKKFIRIIRLLDTKSIKASQVLLVNGEYMSSVISKVYGVTCISCPSGAKLTKKMSEKARSSGSLSINRQLIRKPYILLTNRHFAQKRFENAIVVLSSITNQFPDLRLIITGEKTDYTKEVSILIKRLNLNNRVIFTEYVKEENLVKLYRNAILYIYTAPEEDFGMGVIEAMASGLAVIAWDNAGPSKTVDDGVTGYLIKLNELGDMEDSIVRLLTDDKLRSDMGRSARKRVKELYTWENHAKILGNSITNALEK